LKIYTIVGSEIAGIVRLVPPGISENKIAIFRELPITAAYILSCICVFGLVFAEGDRLREACEHEKSKSYH